MITNTSKKEYIKMTNVASKNQHLLLSSVCGFVLFSLFGPDGFKEEFRCFCGYNCTSTSTIV